MEGTLRLKRLLSEDSEAAVPRCPVISNMVVQWDFSVENGGSTGISVLKWWFNGISVLKWWFNGISVLKMVVQWDFSIEHGGSMGFNY